MIKAFIKAFKKFQGLQADQLVNILDMPPLEAHGHAINQQAGNVVRGPLQDHDEIIPAITKCAVCDVERRTCDPNCEYRHTLPFSKLLVYRETINTYGKEKLFDWSRKIPADKKLKYFDNRIEESVNLQGDLLGGSAKIIHNQAARIHELEEQVKLKDAVIRQMQRM